MKGERKQFSPASLKATMDAGRRRRTVLKKISVSDSQLVGKVGKKEDDLSVTTGVSSRRGSERGQRLLRFSDCLSPGLGSCRPSSRRTPVRSVSLYLCAYLPPPSSPPHLCMQCQPTPPPSTSPRSLSAAVKSDRLQVCFLSEGRFTAAVRPQAPLYDIAPLPIY